MDAFAPDRKRSRGRAVSPEAPPPQQPPPAPSPQPQQVGVWEDPIEDQAVALLRKHFAGDKRVVTRADYAEVPMEVRWEYAKKVGSVFDNYFDDLGKFEEWLEGQFPKPVLPAEKAK